MMLGKYRVPVTAVLTVLLVLGLGMSAANAQTPTPDDDDDMPTRTVSVSGSAQVSIQPDRATITLGVENQAETAGAAISENSQAVQSVIDALIGAGVAEEDIQTQRVQLQPQYEAPETRPTTGRGELVGYRASNTVRITVRDLEAMGELLDTAVEAGANVVQGIGFSVSDTTELVDEGLARAMQDARRKAELLAGQADAELGSVLSIIESSRVPGPVLERGVGVAGEADVPIQPGTVVIEVQVSVVWLLQ